MENEKKLSTGESVIVSSKGGWANDFKGTVEGEPETIETKQGEELAYWVKFNEPQHDISDDGPYRKAQILTRYLSKAHENERLDSKNIFNAYRHMKMKIDWEKELDNEWSFVGEGKDYKEKKVSDFIKSFFNDPQIYLVFDRHHAFPINIDEASSKVGELLNDKDITLCDQSFTKMIEFNYIGVLRHGEVK